MPKVEKLIPLFNRIIVKKSEPILHSKGGILIPEHSKKKRGMKGTVVAVGTGDINKSGERVPMSIKVGDVVLLPDYGGIPVRSDAANKEKQDDYFILRETEILAKFEPHKADG